jgi:hypothetical protein
MRAFVSGASLMGGECIHADGTCNRREVTMRP